MDHHAQLWLATELSGTTLPELYKTPSVDIVHVTKPVFGIQEVRTITPSIYRKPVAAAERVFVLVCRQLTREAQNALLKVLEEPPVTSRFVLVVPQENILLPTLRSRLQLMNTASTSSNETFAEFLRNSYAERLDRIATANKKKDTLWYSDVVHGLESYMTTETNTRAVMRVADMVVRHSGTRGASNKMLLELLALSLPVGHSSAK